MHRDVHFYSMNIRVQLFWPVLRIWIRVPVLFWSLDPWFGFGIHLFTPESYWWDWLVYISRIFSASIFPDYVALVFGDLSSLLRGFPLSLVPFQLIKPPNVQRSYLRELGTIFLGKKYWSFWPWILWKYSDVGSGIIFPDPYHWEKSHKNWLG